MKNIGFLLVLLFCSYSYGQMNPFEKYNYTPKIGTLSNGEFIEDFDNDSIVRIGSVMLNVDNNTITSFVKETVKFTEAGAEPTVMSRWFSPDPLANQFPADSPYVFVKNNPIKYVDPTGLAPLTIYKKIGSEETVEVADGVDTTIEVNETDFQEAQFFANEINSDPDENGMASVGVSQEMADAYTEFFNEHRSFDDMSIDNVVKFFTEQPELKISHQVIGGAGGLELIGGPAKQTVTAMAKLTGYGIKIQKHHIIPKAIFKANKKLLAPFMKLNGGFNLKKLPTPFHGNHPQYNKFVGRRINELARDKNINAESLRNLQHELNGLLNDAYSSGKKLNEFFRNVK